MPNDLNSPERPENGKPRPHPLPERTRRRLGGHRTWFSVVLVLIAVIILIWMFFPF